MSASQENSCNSDEVCIDLSKPSEAPQYELSDFEATKVLNNNSNRKTVCILGRFKNMADDALLLLEKKAFANSQLQSKADANSCGDADLGYFSPQTKLRKEFQNDIYGNYECFPMPEINSNKHFFNNKNMFNNNKFVCSCQNNDYSSSY